MRGPASIVSQDRWMRRRLVRSQTWRPEIPSRSDDSTFTFSLRRVFVFVTPSLIRLPSSGKVCEHIARHCSKSCEASTEFPRSSRMGMCHEGGLLRQSARAGKWAGLQLRRGGGPCRTPSALTPGSQMRVHVDHGRLVQRLGRTKREGPSLDRASHRLAGRTLIVPKDKRARRTSHRVGSNGASSR
jgi:hypothetical protein